MSADPAIQQQQRNSGRFQKGHKGFKPKGAKNKLQRGLRDAALAAAANLGGKGGLEEYLKNNPKLLNDLLLEILPARAKGVLVDAAGDPIDVGAFDTPRDGPVVDTVNIIAIPSGDVIIGLFGQFEVHMPPEAVAKLRDLLPAGSITRPPSAGPHIDPEWLAPPSSDAPPALRVIDGGEPDPAA